MEVNNINIKDINPSPMNPRKTFDAGELQELADNIKRQGLLQPITVRPLEWHDFVDEDGDVVSVPETYEIVCGERRYRALKLNGAPAVPCIVREMTDDEAFFAMVTENLQRADVSPTEEAAAFRLLNDKGMSVEDIAAKFGKSRRFVAERIKMDALIPELKEWVKGEQMAIGAALVISKLEEAQQRDFYETMLHDHGDEAEEHLSPGEEITRKEAQHYIERIFRHIDRAEWAENFAGGCCCTCAECEYNDKNEGCLFHDIYGQEGACCTNPDRWRQKYEAWIWSYVEEMAHTLVKAGEQMTPGKTIIAEKIMPWESSNADVKSFLSKCRDAGYRVVGFMEYFNRFQDIPEDREDLPQLLAENKAYRIIAVYPDYMWRVKVSLKYYMFTETTEEAPTESESNDKVVKLISKYKKAEEDAEKTVAEAQQVMIDKYDMSKISWKALSDTEWQVFLAMLVDKFSYMHRKALGEDVRPLEYAASHNTAEGRENLIREFIRMTLKTAYYYGWGPALQNMIVEEWGIDAAEAKIKAAKDKQRKQANVENQLMAMGYDVHGRKLDF